VSLHDLEKRGIVKRDHPLAGMTTYKFGGRADWYAEVETLNDLVEVTGAGVPFATLGRGSNMVVADGGYRGVVVKLAGEFSEVTFDGDEVVAGGAVSLPRLARACAAADRGGLEWYVGIPGSVGGAIVMNAGGHGSDTAAWLIHARVFDPHTGRIRTETPEQLGLRYRHSELTSTHVVLDARFRTIARSRHEGEAIMREITAWRKEHQPGGTFNAGSVFKNPPGDAAGRIIDAAGLKGLRVGGVSVSERHANFFVADEDACAQDVFDLVQTVQRAVVESTGITLEPEIRFVGDFGAST